MRQMHVLRGVRIFAVVVLAIGACTAVGAQVEPSSGLEGLFGEELADRDGETVATASVEAEKIGVFFGAQWCPYCRDFTPQLVDTYHELQDRGESFEVIFVSGDNSESEMYSYMQDYDMEWLATGYSTSRAGDLRRHFGVTGYPTLIIIDAAGEVLSQDGRTQVAQRGAGAYDLW